MKHSHPVLVCGVTWVCCRLSNFLLASLMHAFFPSWWVFVCLFVFLNNKSCVILCNRLLGQECRGFRIKSSNFKEFLSIKSQFRLLTLHVQDSPPSTESCLWKHETATVLAKQTLLCFFFYLNKSNDNHMKWKEINATKNECL